MFAQSARITLKQHWFEVGAGAMAAILLGAAALWVNSRLIGVNVPDGCFGVNFGGGAAFGAECEAPVQEFARIAEAEAGKVFAGMVVLPFAVGLLAGVALVGREIEARTAQIAWALSASRRRWFGRQLWPVLIAIGVTVTFAALAASILESTLAMFYTFVWQNLGLHGPLVVARALAALGVGLISGAAVGRTLPAFVFGVVLCVALILLGGMARDGWKAAQVPVVLGPTSNSAGLVGLMVGDAWLAPDGRLIDNNAAMGLVGPEGSGDPWSWLAARGYEEVRIGITAETAREWEPLEFAGYALVGIVLVLGTLPIVDRRRPV